MATKIPGLKLRTRANGSGSWMLYYVTKDGVERRPKLGDAAVLTQRDAEKLARALLLDVAAGKDPIAEREGRRAAPTVAALAVRYWERHAREQKASRDSRRHLDDYIVPLLGKIKVVDIAYADCEKLHDIVACTAPIQANRVLATFSMMLSLAERWEMRPLYSNPCLRVKRTTESKRRRYMTDAEAPKIGAALRAHEAADPASVAFLWLLILSGARRGEIARAKWSDITGALLHLPDGKTGARDIHLPVQVLELLAKLPRTDEGTITGIADPTKLWQTIRVKAGCVDLRIHDLRRSFASVGVSAGLTMRQIGQLLGHKNESTTAGYAYLMTEAANEAAGKIADRTIERMGGK
jgi:integrase